VIDEVETLIVEVGQMFGMNLKPFAEAWKQWPPTIKETSK
jgi:hypothetical protein